MLHFFLIYFSFALWYVYFPKPVEAYKVLYAKNYAELSSNSLISNQFFWQDQSLNKISDCSNTSCQFASNGTPASVVLPSGSDTQLTYKFSIPGTTLHSTIGIDITYISSSPAIYLNLLSEPQILISSTSPIYNIEDEPGKVNCPSYFPSSTRIYRASAVSHTNISGFGSFVVTKTSPTQFLGIRSISLWVNCVENCNSCSTSTECTDCMGSFQDHTEIISGVSVLTCEVTFNCGIGCRQCYFQGGTSVCKYCQAGYTLTSTVCIQNLPANPSVSCDPKTQYINSSGLCSFYSTTAYYQDKSGSSWIKFEIDDPSIYKCPDLKLILALDRYNFQQLRCTCMVVSCKKCVDSTTCAECAIENYYTLDRTKCLPCSISNCQSCQNSYGSSCQKCKSGFILSKTTPLSCIAAPCPSGLAFNTATNSCESCTDPNYVDSYGNCVPIQCDDNQIFDTIEKTCVDCEAGQVESGGVCVDIVCSASEQFEQTLNTCVSKTKNKGGIKATLTKEGYIIELEFQYQLKVYQGFQIEQLIDIKVSQGTLTDFSFDNINLSENKINFNLFPNTSFKQESLQLTILDSDFSLLNSLESTQYSSSLDNFIYLTSEQKETNKAIASFSETASMVLITTIIPIAIFSNFYVIVNTIDITGFLYYLLFIDIRYPDNVLSFFGFFENFQFPFIPSMFEPIISSDYVQEAPQKFIDNGFQPYFLSNSGQSITIVAFILGIYVVGKAFSYVRIPKVQPYLVRAMRETWEFSAFFDLLWSLYIYFLIGSLLQFLVYDSGEENYILNYTLHTIFAAIHVLCPFLITSFLYKKKNLKSDKVFQQKFATLVGGIILFDENGPQPQVLVNQSVDQIETSKFSDSPEMKKINPSQNPIEGHEVQLQLNESNQMSKRYLHQVKLSKLYNGILYIRKLLFGFIIVFGTSYPYLQLILITALNIGMTIYIFYIMPLESKHENIKNACGEIVLILIQLSVMLLVEDEPSDIEDDRIELGWIIVGLSASIMLWHALQMIIETLKSIGSSIKSLFKSKDPKSAVKVEVETSKKGSTPDNPSSIKDDDQMIQKNRSIEQDIPQKSCDQTEANTINRNELRSSSVSAGIVDLSKQQNAPIPSMRRKTNKLKFVQLTNRSNQFYDSSRNEVEGDFSC